ncbi:MAG: hypothetical protein AAFW74_12030 [Pseudomonadota bacterium]
MKDTTEQTGTFENTYPKYPFSELVRLSLKLTGYLVAHCSKAGRTEVARTHKLFRTQGD